MAYPVLTLQAMRDWEERTWAQGVLEADVIAQVGRRIAERIMEMTAPGDSILLLAGKGHNGDDVCAAIPWLSRRSVQLIRFHHVSKQTATFDAALADAPDLVVEGLFGIGLNRALEGDWADVVHKINDSRATVVSIDIPSGLHADSGQPLGCAIRADQTWTVGAPKADMVAQGASVYVGRMSVLADVGLTDLGDVGMGGVDLYWGDEGDFVDWPPKRPLESHKGSHGCVQVLAGSRGYHGAAVLAARGATRARPGLVELMAHVSSVDAVALQLQNVMVHAFDRHLLVSPKTTAVVMGPGLASNDIHVDVKIQVAEIWRDASVPVVADASALDWLPVSEESHSATRVITPHPGEAARMLGISSQAVQADRLAALRSLSVKYGHCWVVLKGHHTMIGRSSGPVYINPSGNPNLAQGGAGDILAGFLGGLLAQHALMDDPEKILRYGVWAHGHAADQCQALLDSWDVNQLPDWL